MQAPAGVADVKVLGHELDLLLHRQQQGGPNSTAEAATAAAAEVTAGAGGIKREPPSTPELDNIMDWLTLVNGPATASPPATAVKQLVSGRRRRAHV